MNMIISRTERLMKNYKKIAAAGPLLLMLFLFDTAFAQDPKKQWTDGEIENVEIEIMNEREITLPDANRNFEKIPPRPSEPIKPPITYDFQSFNFQAPQINPQIRPLKLKQENPSNVYGGFVRVGYGNYVSPLLEAYYNTRRDKNKLVGAHLYHTSSDKGPVDDRNSGTGSSGLSVFGRSFTKGISLSGNAGFENRTTHFYGYPEGTEVEASSIKQSYNLLKIAGALSNAKNSDFSYKLGAGVSHLTDKYDAKETEFDVEFSSAYEISEDSKINLKGDYFFINRKDENVEKKARSLFVVSPSFAFVPVEDLKVSVGFIAAFENDTINSKSVHVYPDIKAAYPISPSVEAFASLSGGMEKVSLQTLSYENIWLAPNVPIFHTNKTIDFNVGLKAKLGNKITAHSGLAVANLKNWYYFVNTTADQAKFTTVYDGGSGTKRANLYGALSFVQSEVAKFMLRADLYRYSTARIGEPWHRPTYKVTANAFYNLYEKFLFNVDIIAQGGMKAQEPITNNTIKLDAAFDLNFKTEYLFSESFSAFIQLNNIASSKYPVFLYYPVRGFQIMGGITWSF
ncbi:hypothetical protein [Chryseolinea sp. H1M3-3]|uniref:hypothetical protein n=1 Tax=Chryseolinea sp. H1M3-3 TaxID=3034144 RepID=UPI0023EB4E3D|nr:hypothetical protein [Chryseolinea sp. H1M3-3]